MDRGIPIVIDPGLMRISDAEAISTGLLGWVAKGCVGGVAVPEGVGVQAEIVSENTFEATMNVKVAFRAELNPEWYTKLGIFMKILTQKPDETWHRAATLFIQYLDPTQAEYRALPQACFGVTILFRMLVVKVSATEKPESLS